MTQTENPDRKPVGLTRRALADIREIQRYSVARWGRKAADKYLDEIETALDRLFENPGLLGQQAEFATGLSCYRVRSHYLICDCESKSIVVLAVVHSSMDLPARLSELLPDIADEIEFLHRKLGEQSK